MTCLMHKPVSPSIVPLVLIGLALCFSSVATPLVLETPKTTIRIQGEVGARLDAVIENWLLTAPDVNPGMLEMMRLRDRKPPYENPLAWSGEFIGKYLTSAILTLRMTDSEALRSLVERCIVELCETQAEDGYLGPFGKEERLLAHWDLWGHYHAMYALWLWHHDTGDEAALASALRAADLVCATYLDTERRVLDAGYAEMNMAVMHVLGLLYRQSGREAYLRMMQEILKDMEKPPAGDYFRLASTGIEFFETPKPRWESLHPMLGLGEFYRITGEEEYKQAVLHWWHSIRKTDVHNAGSFSTHEKAVGNPFMEGAIETCCTVAWIAYSVEALRLAQDSTIADALELATWNAVLGYTHPSGRWCTYDTPMDGKRKASAHAIVFQARPGTPELNCCSVNGPRGLALLSDWAILGGSEGLYLNYYGPGTMEAALGDGSVWRFSQETSYPQKGAVKITVDPDTNREATLFLRIPAWSEDTALSLNGLSLGSVSPGSYFPITRSWTPGDVIQLDLDMRLHVLRGDSHVDFKTSLFHGPLLLSYDQSLNSLDPGDLPQLDLKTLVLEEALCQSRFQPIVFFRVQGSADQSYHLCDYATAGARGGYYKSWLDVENAPPVPFALSYPAHKAILPKEKTSLTWDSAEPGAYYHLRVATDADFQQLVYEQNDLKKNRVEVDLTAYCNRALYWRVDSILDGVSHAANNGPRSFSLDPTLQTSLQGTVVNDLLAGKVAPLEGAVVHETWLKKSTGPDGREKGALRFNGKWSKLVYAAPAFPRRSYTFCAWFKPEEVDANDHTWRHIFSAWAKGNDDPLRVSIRRGRLEVNIEQAEEGCHIQGPVVESAVWRHVGVVKEHGRLRLYLDGKLLREIKVPEQLISQAKTIGIGSNPNYSEPEVFRGSIARIFFSREALSGEEIQALSKAP